jgi:glucose-1-phosphate thymidylyltransferase
VRLVEKPREFVSDLALIGVYLFDDSIVEACATLRPSWRGELEITEAIQRLIDDGRTVGVRTLEGWWKDTGRPEDLLEANRMLLADREPKVAGDVDDETTVEGLVTVAAGASVRRSALVGPVVIGPGCVVEDSALGPDVSLEEGCVVRASAVRDSIVMAGSSVVDVVALEGSILGRHVDVCASGGDGVHRLVVGDQSRVEVD